MSQSRCEHAEHEQCPRFSWSVAAAYVVVSAASNDHYAYIDDPDASYVAVACILRAWNSLADVTEWLRLSKRHAFCHVHEMLCEDVKCIAVALERHPWHESYHGHSSADNEQLNSVGKRVDRVYQQRNGDDYTASIFVEAAMEACHFDLPSNNYI